MVLNEIEFSTQLSAFFENWKRLSVVVNDIEEKTLYIDHSALAGFFQRFDKAIVPISEARKNGLKLNIWQGAAGLKEDELRNCAVLKWFLDWRGDHGQENAILLEFLQLLPEQFRSFKPNRYQIIEECCPLGNQENRIDIEINSDEFLLFIEVKINAVEGQNQLQRYVNIARVKAANKKWLIVYLTKDGKLPQQYQNDDGVFGLSWLSVARQFKSYANIGAVNNRGAWLLSQFADHIKNFK
ncbi:PD-(D/E)XK nuclease family protein [Acinetobacter sp. BSP-153]|uniref:PD-(D/E)XK nuclease family protein n=1 Tax=Acinetobacter sp. BSP-153 TaxID=3344663 RepID=UPI00376F8FF4